MREVLKQEYKTILDAYLAGAGEAAVMQAYDFARKCLRSGLAPDDVVEFHVDLTDHVRDAQPQGQSLLLEVVMAFSMAYRQTLEELKSANHELDRVSRFKSSMLSMVAHDLTNHLMAIRMFATTIVHKQAGSDTGHHADNILEVVTQQEMLIANLLDIGRIDSGRIELRKQSLPLKAMVERAVARAERTTSRHAFAVVGDEVEVTADRARLQQVLDNLIGNAIKYSPTGGPVDISIEHDRIQAVTTVADNGIGIAEKDLDRLFEPFFRGSSAPLSRIPGTGLGLSIVRSLIQLQGGTIDVSSREGEGTRVRFTLPLSATTASRVDGKPEPTPPVPIISAQ